MRDTAVAILIFAGVAGLWAIAPSPEGARVSSIPSAATTREDLKKGIVNENPRDVDPKGTPQASETLGDTASAEAGEDPAKAEEFEKLASIYEREESPRGNSEKSQPVVARAAGVPISRWWNDRRRQFVYLPQQTPETLRVVVGCMEVQRKSWASVQPRECRKLHERSSVPSPRHDSF